MRHGRRSRCEPPKKKSRTKYIKSLITGQRFAVYDRYLFFFIRPYSYIYIFIPIYTYSIIELPFWRKSKCSAAIVHLAQRLMMQKNNTLLNIIGLVIYIYILFISVKPFIVYNAYDIDRYNPKRDFFSSQNI